MDNYSNKMSISNIYVKMTDSNYIGSGVVVKDGTSNLTTQGLCGCVAFAVEVNHCGKRLVWLSHIASDVRESTLRAMLPAILQQINFMLQTSEPLTWQMFNGMKNKIKLVYNRRPGQSAKTAFLKDGSRIELDKMISRYLHAHNAVFDEYPGNSKCCFLVENINVSTAKMFKIDPNTIVVSFKTEV